MTARITSIDNATIKDPIVKTSNVNNTYTLTLPKKAGTVALTSDITSATSSLATQSALNTVSSNVDALEDRMDGVQQAKVFDTVAAMNTWLANSANTATLLVGTNLYIRALDVPDYWWDGTQAQELETSKVNLNDAATKTGTETLTNKTITDPILKDDSTDYTLTVPTLTENTQIATTKDLTGYATTSHNHDGVYAPASHTHSQYLTQSSLTNYATLTGTETLTNKSLTAPILTSSTLKHNEGNITYTHILPLGSHELVDERSEQELRNKTLTYCTLDGARIRLVGNTLISNDGTHMIYINDTVEDTETQIRLITEYATQNLYNKRLYSPTITSPTITTPTIASIKCGAYTLTVPNLTQNTTIATTKDLTGYSTTSHNHDSAYAAASHNHDTAYASISHNHDTTYAAKSHSHSTYATKTGTEELTNKTITNPTLKDSSTSYNLTVPTLSQNTTIATAKDLTGYSTTSHNHDSAYAPKDHTHSNYALVSHDHDNTYAFKNHTHSRYVTIDEDENIYAAKTFHDFKLGRDKITLSNGSDVCFGSLTGVNIVTTPYLVNYVKMYDDQTIGGTKTFSAAPKLSTNTIKRSNDAVIILPSAAATLATTTLSETLKNKTLDSTNNIDAITPGSSSDLMKAIIDIIYPVGIVCFFYSTDNPNDKFPGTAWEILSTGKYVQTRAQNTASATGGSSTSGSTTLKLTDIPAHNHTASSTFTGTATTGTFNIRNSANSDMKSVITAATGVFSKSDNTGSNQGRSHQSSSDDAKDTVVTFTYTPAGSVSTTTGNSGGGGGHTHSINPPYITLAAWRRRE